MARVSPICCPLALVRTVAVGLLAIGLVLALAGAARADETEDYALGAIPGVTVGQCASGQADADGNFYLACGTTIRIYGLDGSLETVVSGVSANDVAPSPHGDYIYFSDGGAVSRADRQLDGSYVVDQSWELGPFPWYGSMLSALATHLATDAYGSIYIADGMWTSGSTPNTVVKYTANGTYVTRFGTYTDGDTTRVNASGATTDPRVWTVGEFWGLSGITTSRNGEYVYTTEIYNGRVTRWDLQANGTYQAAMTFGNSAQTDPTHAGSCASGMLGAPYDVGTDPWGDVYAVSTSCTSIQKWDADGNFLYSSYTGDEGQGSRGTNPDGSQQRSHYLAIDAHGNVWTSETGNRLTRPAASEPGAWPALPASPPLAPPLAVTALVLPVSTTTSTIAVAVSASGAPSTMRFSVDGGATWEAWQQFTAYPVSLSLPAGLGLRSVETEVADQGGHVSAALYRTITVVAAPVTVAPPAVVAPAAPAGAVAVSRAAAQAAAAAQAQALAAAKAKALALAKEKAKAKAKRIAAARAKARELAWKHALAKMTPARRAKAIAKARAAKAAAVKAAAKAAAAKRAAAAVR